MNPKNIIPIFIAGIMLFSCKPKRDPSRTYFDTPDQYNDYIVTEQKDVMNAFETWAGSVNRHHEDTMRMFLDQLDKRNQLALASTTKLADFKGDTAFRFAALELFRFMDAAVKNELSQIVELAAKDSSITDAEVEEIHRLNEVYTIKEKEKNDALISAQEAFGKKFNVTIQ